MLDTIRRVEITLQSINQAVELSSLIGSYLPKKDYRKLLEADFKLIQRLRKGVKGLREGTQCNLSAVLNGKEKTFDKTQISELEQIIRQKEDEYQKMKSEIKQRGKKYFDMIIGNNDVEISELDLEELLNGANKVNILDRIRELYADEGVRQFYEKQLKQRKAGFEILEDGQKKIKEVFEIEAIIKKAKDIILRMRIKAFMDRRTLKPAEISFLRKIQEGISKEQIKLSKILQQREVATVYRLNSLKRYKHQLERSGFVNVPSRGEIIDEVVEKLLLGENVLLTGPTGTGKTVLAIESVKKIASQMNIGYEEISGKTLGEEIKGDPKGANKMLDEFAVVLSGHSGITTSEFIAKPTLKSDGKGGTYTDTQLGKLLKAFVEGKIPIIDEIDLIPNDILMRVKHLFTLKPGQEYSPQEDGDKRHILKTTSIIATANIKSEKHPDREELDPAIVRLFKGVQVPYLTLDESYDVAIAHLMENGGYIYDISLPDLQIQRNETTGNIEKYGLLCALIKSLKDIEASYLGKSNGDTLNIGGSDKSGLYLQKAVLELGNFVSMFKGFKESGLSFKEFMKGKIIEFVSNGAYPKNDRLLLIKIFSTNGLLIKSDIPRLTKRITDISESELEKNIMGTNNTFTDEGPIKFIDPYELANLDPYKVRKLKDLEMGKENRKAKGLLEIIGEKYVSTGTEAGNILMDLIKHILDQFSENPDYEITDEEIKVIYECLYKESDTENLGELSLLGDKWKTQFEELKKNDTKGKLNGVNPEPTPPSPSNGVGNPNSIESADINRSVTEFIIDSCNRRINRLKTEGKMEVDGGDIEVNLTTIQKNGLREITSSEIRVVSMERKDITIEGNREQFYIVQLDIRGLRYTAVEVPNLLRTKPLGKTRMGGILKGKSSNTWFPRIDLDEGIGSRWIIEETENNKGSNGNVHTDIHLLNQGETTDVVREVANLGMKTVSIKGSMILGDIIMYGLGIDYVMFSGDKADLGQAGCENIRNKIKEINKYLGIFFGEYKTMDGRVHIIRNFGIYVNHDNRPKSFIRGGSYNDKGCIGGVFSLCLHGDLDVRSSFIGFRSSV